MNEEMNFDVTVIGGGPAGLAAALEAHKEGGKVLLIEREEDAIILMVNND